MALASVLLREACSVHHDVSGIIAGQCPTRHRPGPKLPGARPPESQASSTLRNMPFLTLHQKFLLHSTLSLIGDLTWVFHGPCPLLQVRFILSKTVIVSPASTKQSGSTRYRPLSAQSRALPSANQVLSAWKASERCYESCLLPMCVHGHY